MLAVVRRIAAPELVEVDAVHDVDAVVVAGGHVRPLCHGATANGARSAKDGAAAAGYSRRTEPGQAARAARSSARRVFFAALTVAWWVLWAASKAARAARLAARRSRRAAFSAAARWSAGSASAAVRSARHSALAACSAVCFVARAAFSSARASAPWRRTSCRRPSRRWCRPRRARRPGRAGPQFSRARRGAMVLLGGGRGGGGGDGADERQDEEQSTHRGQAFRGEGSLIRMRPCRA